MDKACTHVQAVDEYGGQAGVYESDIFGEPVHDPTGGIGIEEVHGGTGDSVVEGRVKVGRRPETHFEKRKGVDGEQDGDQDQRGVHDYVRLGCPASVRTLGVIFFPIDPAK